ncbi:plasmid mobilization relaxosome protein MobC [Panacibacter ginsenosidivorans]|uniref:Plasmid mobilization relaxosome protein MobC n=1 Tax=Panacibacter ginsenosidivorans TaxID=1813871 RepID=A0A5B8VFC1_9BACT|nr:plasmid mobilization relaxosome protein MobC [Panacibacter ginsenosidivorans]QEC69731.1 plasmid mobilization relaxosome protein MobC [Panacibacter ginsenosidivorans]
MKKKESEVRRTFIKIRMNDAEIKMVKKYKSQTTERSLSEYMRKVSMQKPITIKYRNQSADDFLKEMLGLKKELNAIGNNFNQAVHKLHLLDKIPEFRVWLNHYESVQQSLVSKVEEIKLKVSKLYEEWLQK